MLEVSNVALYSILSAAVKVQIIVDYSQILGNLIAIQSAWN